MAKYHQIAINVPEKQSYGMKSKKSPKTSHHSNLSLKNIILPVQWRYRCQPTMN